MKLNIRKHIFYYSGFLIVQILSFFLILFSAHDKQFQMMIVVLTTFFYILWAALHHYMHHDLHARVVIEYILVGALGISIMFLVLNN